MQNLIFVLALLAVVALMAGPIGFLRVPPADVKRVAAAAGRAIRNAFASSRSK